MVVSASDASGPKAVGEQGADRAVVGSATRTHRRMRPAKHRQPPGSVALPREDVVVTYPLLCSAQAHDPRGQAPLGSGVLRATPEGGKHKPTCKGDGCSRIPHPCKEATKRVK